MRFKQIRKRVNKNLKFFNNNIQQKNNDKKLVLLLWYKDEKQDLVYIINSLEKLHYIYKIKEILDEISSMNKFLNIISKNDRVLVTRDSLFSLKQNLESKLTLLRFISDQKSKKEDFFKRYYLTKVKNTYDFDYCSKNLDSNTKELFRQQYAYNEEKKKNILSYIKNLSFCFYFYFLSPISSFLLRFFLDENKLDKKISDTLSLLEKFL